MNKSNIGIITLFTYHNYGQRLQNFALSETLADLGYNATTLYFKEPKVHNKHLFNFTNTYIQSRLIKKPEELQEYDSIVVGSDQVFNYNFGSYKPILDFINPVLLQSLVAYAASFGVDRMIDRFKDRYKEHLSKYHALSVREDAGVYIIRELIGREAEVLPDPVFLFNDWEALLTPAVPKNPYLLSFFIHEDAGIDRPIAKLAKERKLRLLNLHEPRVFDFLKRIRDASLVISNSFHVINFAIIFRVPFMLVENRKDMTSRFDTLLSRLGLLDYRLFNPKQILDFDLVPDYDQVHKILTEDRERGLAFLQRNLPC